MKVAAAPARGVALATCLLLLTVFAIIAIAGFTAAMVDLRISQNLDQRERAFNAAEYGVEQAIRVPDLSTGWTRDAPRAVPEDGVSVPVPGSDADHYSYRLYHAGTTASGLPALDPASALTAFHFVIEATGYSARGGTDTHVQSFRVLRPAAWSGGPVSAACAPDEIDCVPPPEPEPRRTTWLQQDAE